MALIRRVRRLILWLATVTAASQSQPNVDPNALITLAARRIEAGVDRQRRFACDASIAREFSPHRRYRPNAVYAVERSLARRCRGFRWPAVLFVAWNGDLPLRRPGRNDGRRSQWQRRFRTVRSEFLADSDPASVQFRGVGEWAGRRVAEYSYDVPRVSSHYEVKAGPDRFERTAYLGSMFVDAETGDLRRLVIHVPWAARRVRRSASGGRYSL